jgi:hypothetical protein
MDFLIELLLQFIVQVVIEVIFEAIWRGLARAFRAPTGRYALTAVVGVGFGIGWGWHLASEPHPPNLLWASTALAIAALVMVRRKSGLHGDSISTSGDAAWRRALSPPRTWPPDRWMDFAVLNVAIAAGILAGYSLG